MNIEIHPTSTELVSALQDPHGERAITAHLSTCVACRVRFSRLRDLGGYPAPSDDAIQRIASATTPVSDQIRTLVAGSQDTAPAAGEIWRVGREMALLVWVRKVFDDGVADVIPVVFDVELADAETILVDGDRTPLGMDLAVMVSLRTHIHIGSFLNRLSALDLSSDVDEVVTALRENRRPSGLKVGMPIIANDDQRIEYRQALRGLLAELAPSTWEPPETPNANGSPGLKVDDQGASSFDETADIGQSAVSRPPAETGPSWETEIDRFKQELEVRLPDVQCHRVWMHRADVDPPIELSAVLKVSCLDTSILVTVLDGTTEFPSLDTVASPLELLLRAQPDADAAVVCLAIDDWPAMLVATQHLRWAWQLPEGIRVGPTVTLEGLGVVDILAKYLDNAVTAWEVTEQNAKSLGSIDLRKMAIKHADKSLESVVKTARRSGPQKKVAWESLPEDMSDRVAQFVAAARHEPIEQALSLLGLEDLHD